MSKYLTMAKAAGIVGGKKLPIADGDSDDVKALKKMPYFEFNFARVKNAPIQTVGVYAKDEDAATKEVARIIEEFYNPPTLPVQ